MPREQLIKAQTLGASTWQVAIRVVLPQIMPRLIKCAAAVARAGVPVPDLGGGDRLRCRARLPHLPGAALSGDGRDPALCRLDHAARLSHRSRAGLDRSPCVPVGLSCRSRADERTVLPQRLGRIRRSGRARTHQSRDRVRHVPLGGRAVGRGQEHLPAPDPRPGAADAGRGAARWRAVSAPSPAPIAASCSSAIRCFRI